MERSWAVLNSIFMNNKGLSHTLKDRTPFFITVTKTLIMQITWNTILYHWHAPPAINYGKLLVLFFYKIFPASMSLSFFFWFAPNDSLTLSRRRPISYRNQSTDLLRKSMDWFLYDIGLRPERVKRKQQRSNSTFSSLNLSNVNVRD